MSTSMEETEDAPLFQSQKEVFRFLRLDEPQAEALRLVCPDVRLKRRRGGGRFFVGEVSLDPDQDYRWIKKFIEQHALAETEYGFFVSVVTEYGSPIIGAPKHVVKLIQAVGGVVGFSFKIV